MECAGAAAGMANSPDQEQERREEKSSTLPNESEGMPQVESDSAIVSEDPAFNVESSHRSASRCLHLACKFDSTASLSSLLEVTPVDTLDDSGHTALHYAAEQYSVRCIELLLKRRAKMDVKSAKGLTALEIALQSDRVQIISWSPGEKITELLTLTGDKDLTALKILASHARDSVQVASSFMVHGNIVAFAALLTVAGDTLISTPVLSNEEQNDGTLFDVLVKTTIAVGEQVQDDDLESHGSLQSDTKSKDLRHILLKELELLLRWYLDHHQSSDFRRRTPPTSSIPSPLTRAAQAGDIAVATLLIDHEADVNETDSGGNTALHWALRASSNTRNTRLILKLVRHGASITLGNRLGLTPVHIAAGLGHLQALQIFLAVEPSSGHVTAETRETPLFSAVKGNHYDCVRLLLQNGASRHVLNLRKQRPIDVADTSDMRALLSLQEPSGRVKDLRYSGMYAFDSDFSEHTKLKSEISQQFEFSDECLKAFPAKTEMCRYFSMPGGCVRGDKCFYSHGEEDLQGRQKLPGSGPDIKQALVPFNAVIAPGRMLKRPASEDLSKKIFVGGLSASVESDDLREFFEGKFGAVTDAVVIGNHAGDHIQSRGFGFVTFKEEESVNAAVQAHYVNIFGKKVEIKGAVPRSSVLPPIESSRGGPIELCGSSSSEFSKFSEVDPTKVLDFSSLDLLCQARGDLQIQLVNYVGPYGENPTIPFKLFSTEEREPSSATSSSLCTSALGVNWVTKFKQWLPKFLAEVSNRLKEGEWYPLSSLKGDFRATCGLELDHAGIGYHKLSDFVRSIPEACRMKIVPVGRGPATHMVLLPALPRTTSTVAVQVLGSKSSGPAACGSLVDAGRSYAAAACQVPAKSMAMASCNAELLAQVSRTVPPTTCSSSQLPEPNLYDSVPMSTYDDLRLVDLNLKSHNLSKSPTHFSVDPRLDHHRFSSLVSQDQIGTPGSSMQPETSRSNLRQLLARLENYEDKQIEERMAVHRPEHNLPMIANNFDMIPIVSSFTPQPCDPGLSNPQEVPTVKHDEEPKTPANQVNLRPFSTFNHPFPGFLPQDTLNSYNMWGNLPNSNQQTKKADAARLWDHDSPQSTLFPYRRGYSHTKPHEAPRSIFSPVGNSPPDDHPWELCVCCCERRSIWVALPCNHYSLCAGCKDILQCKFHHIANCPSCSSPVDRWIALH